MGLLRPQRGPPSCRDALGRLHTAPPHPYGDSTSCPQGVIQARSSRILPHSPPSLGSNTLLCCRLLSSPLEYFFSLSMLWALYLIGPISLAASGGVGTHRLQRPSIRAGTNTRHPILYASFDGSRKACRRRPHLYDGFFQGPEIARAASTSPKIKRGLSTAIPLILL